MVAESVFPKVDGDILYASEANRFASSQKTVWATDFPLFLSGTDRTTIGSLFFAPGSLNNYVNIETNYYMVGRDGNDGSIFIMISGVGGNNEAVIRLDNVAQLGKASIMLGSPAISRYSFNPTFNSYAGWMQTQYTQGDPGLANAFNNFRGYQLSSGITPGLGLVLKYEIKSAGSWALFQTTSITQGVF